MNPKQYFHHSKPFFRYVLDWYRRLAPMPIEAVITGRPERVAIFAVDVTNGFCRHGSLASERVATIVAPITELFQTTYEYGVRHYLLPQDTHTPDAAEFQSYPAHCLAGTPEADTVAELKALPFSESFIIQQKNGLHAALDTDLDPWLDRHSEVDTFVVTGDCTDLCTYQLAMHLQVRAHTRNMQARVIVPANCVQTYHMPVDVATKLGALPHDGDVFHILFLLSLIHI